MIIGDIPPARECHDPGGSVRLRRSSVSGRIAGSTPEKVRKSVIRKAGPGSSTGHLRPGVSQRDVATVLFALTGPELFDLLVTKSGWSPDQYEALLIRVLASELVVQMRGSHRPSRQPDRGMRR